MFLSSLFYLIEDFSHILAAYLDSDYPNETFIISQSSAFWIKNATSIPSSFMSSGLSSVIKRCWASITIIWIGIEVGRKEMAQFSISFKLWIAVEKIGSSLVPV